MKNLSLSFFYITLLVGCSNNNAVKQNNADTNSDYFSDSSECSKVTLRNNQRINVLPMGVRRQLPCPVGDNYLDRLTDM